MARPAAMAALAADRQGKFWDYYDMIYENFRTLNEDALKQFAMALNLDMNRFNKDRTSSEITSLINRDIREGSRIGVRGTPTLFVNGKRLNQRSPEAFSAAIERELNK